MDVEEVDAETVARGGQVVDNEPIALPPGAGQRQLRIENMVTCSARRALGLRQWSFLPMLLVGGLIGRDRNV